MAHPRVSRKARRSEAAHACTNFTGAEGAGASRCPQPCPQSLGGGHFEQGAVRRGFGRGQVSAHPKVYARRLFKEGAAWLRAWAGVSTCDQLKFCRRRQKCGVASGVGRCQHWQAALNLSGAGQVRRGFGRGQVSAPRNGTHGSQILCECGVASGVGRCPHTLGLRNGTNWSQCKAAEGRAGVSTLTW